MSDKFYRKPLAIALGATFAAAMSAAPAASADTNPFGMQDLQSGYMQLAENKCGGKDKEKMESKCGGKDKKEGKCGEGKMKQEGKCGGKDKMEGEGKMKKEGKCGEAKCGGKG